MVSDKDPILAMATAAGSGGIGIVRLSFPSALERAVFDGLFSPDFTPVPRHAHLKAFMDAKGVKLDDLIVLFFKGPNSYTGESVVELQAHGGPVLMGLLQKACLEKLAHLDFRMAEPGEFTKRAYLNGRMDLAQAEAVADVINAMSESALQAAQRSLSGDFSKRIRELGDTARELRAYVEATLDFPEEEVDNLDRGRIFDRLDVMEASLLEIFSQARSGNVLREGVTAAIVGSPNVGKSSLLNALAGEEVAIVTDIAGTTRDKIEHWITINGVPLRVVDTAGIRETQDVVEQKGIERALAEVAKADVIVHLVDATGKVQDNQDTLAVVMKHARAGVPRVDVANKMDVAQTAPEGYIAVSAASGLGLDALRAVLLEKVGMQTTADGLFMARERHLQALARALEHIERAQAFGRDVQMIDLFAEELRLAADALNEILGEFVADDLLGMIFSRFCIGK